MNDKPDEIKRFNSITEAFEYFIEHIELAEDGSDEIKRFNSITEAFEYFIEHIELAEGGSDEIKRFKSMEDAFRYLVKGEGWEKLTRGQRDALKHPKSDFVNGRGITAQRMQKHLERYFDIQVFTTVELKMKKSS